jgi:PAS domain-containing protein
VNTHVAVIPDPTRPRLVAASFDVTERRQMVTQLSRFSDLFNSANDMITVIDPTGQIL